MNDNLKECEEFIIGYLKSYYDQKGISYEDRATLDGWLVDHYNFLMKFVPIKPRNVYYSEELERKLSSMGTEALLVNKIAHKVTTGADLNPYLSKQARKVANLDPLLIDWGIHHFHVEDGVDPNDPYYVKRADYLLFAWITQQDTYFIDIMAHSDATKFSDRNLLEIVQRNWDHLLEPYETGIVALSHNPDTSEVHELRKAGAICGIEINGKVYLMGIYATSGHSFSATRRSNEFHRFLFQNKEGIKRNLEYYKPQILSWLGFDLSPTQP